MSDRTVGVKWGLGYGVRFKFHGNIYHTQSDLSTVLPLRDTIEISHMLHMICMTLIELGPSYNHNFLSKSILVENIYDMQDTARLN